MFILAFAANHGEGNNFYNPIVYLLKKELI